MTFKLVSITSLSTEAFVNEDTTYLPPKVYFIKPLIQQHERLTIHSAIAFASGIKKKKMKEQGKLVNGAEIAEDLLLTH